MVNGDTSPPHKGNAYLHRLFGAEIRPVASEKEREPTMTEVAAEIEGGGGHAVVIPLGASTPLGSLGYVRAATEIDGQFRDHPHPGDTWIFVSASSCGTYAGLALGFTLLQRRDVRLVGVSPDISRVKILALAENLANGAGALLGAQTPLLRGWSTPQTTTSGQGTESSQTHRRRRPPCSAAPKVFYSTPPIRPRRPRPCLTGPKVAAYHRTIGWFSGTPEDTPRPWHFDRSPKRA